MPGRILMDPKSAADYLSLAAQTLARWRVEGGGPRFCKLGGRVRYDVRELDAWIDAQARCSTADPGPQAAA